MKIRLYVRSNNKTFEIRDEISEKLYAVAYDNYIAEVIRSSIEVKLHNDSQIEMAVNMLRESIEKDK